MSFPQMWMRKNNSSEIGSDRWAPRPDLTCIEYAHQAGHAGLLAKGQFVSLQAASHV
jgi:hypothetical protein